MKHILVGSVILLVTYGQLVIKYEVDKLGPIPSEWRQALGYTASTFLNPGILSGFFAAVLAASAWMATLSRYELSSVYPLLSLNSLLVPLLSVVLFGESINGFKAAGALLIATGVFLFAQGT